MVNNKYLVSPEITIKEALLRMDEVTAKVLFVVDDLKRLIGAISDGDIRRSIIHGKPLNDGIYNIMNKKPLYMDEIYDIPEVKKILLEKKISAIPVTDPNGKIIEILFWNDVFNEKKEKFNKIDLPVVIMAGGKGTRLEPFTHILPKPLIPIGEKAMIEIIMDEYAKFGMKSFYISINHKGKMIKAYLDEYDSDFQFKYITEDKPLGTAGALKFLEEEITLPFFVSNCDILIKDDYSKIYDFHKRGNYDLTLVASLQHHTLPYGVCQIGQGGKLKSISEKPQYDYLVNTGMYLLNPEVLQFIPYNKFFHITHLIEVLQKKGFEIGVYPVSENSYIDIGQWSEYKKTVSRFNNL